MKTLLRSLFGLTAFLILGFTTQTTIRAQGRIVIQDRFASINGLKLHYLVAGKGEPVILLHGYAQNSHMWRPLIVELAKTRLVIAPDLRGFGQTSNRPAVRQEDHGAGHSLPGRIARIQAGNSCGARYRINGRLRLRCTVSERG